MSTYLANSFDSEHYLRNSFILFDSCAIIDILTFEAESIMEELETFNAIPCHINQVLLEIYATDRLPERTKRQLFIDQNKFKSLTTVEKNMRERAIKLQTLLHMQNCHPQPTDLYLGASLNSYSLASKTYLLTSNIKDFPEPLFEHIYYIPLVNNSNAKVLALIRDASNLFSE